MLQLEVGINTRLVMQLCKTLIENWAGITRLSMCQGQGRFLPSDYIWGRDLTLWYRAVK